MINIHKQSLINQLSISTVLGYVSLAPKMADEYEQKQLFDSCINALESCMEFVEKYSDEADKRKQTEYLQTVVAKDYCNIDLNHQNSLQAIAATTNAFTANAINPNETAKTVYKKNLKKIGDDDYIAHPVWNRINRHNESVEEVAKENNDSNVEYEDVDGSMLCSQSKALQLDPLSKTAIKNPCRNKRCGHIYEYDTIMVYLQRKSKAVHCPYVGCGNVRMLKSQIVKDDELKKKFEQLN